MFVFGQIISRSNHSVAITTNNEVFSWGSNNYGQLGLGHNKNENKPQLVEFFKDKTVKNIICGDFHSFAISTNGEVFSWGSNDQGELGLGHNNSKKKPQLVDFFKDKSVKKIICGYHHTFAITYGGYVFSWGNNFNGQLGLGHNNSKNEPQLVEFFKGKTVKNIICGNNYSFAITTNDDVFSWGFNDFGQLGLGHNNNENKPHIVEFFKDKSVKKIICGSNHSFAITNNDDVFSWGYNFYGDLGLGYNNYNGQNKPQLVEFFKDKTVKKIICGGNHTFAISSDEDVFSWGFNINGELGLGHYKNENKPQLVEFFEDKTVKKIICGNCHTFAITCDGDVFSWGINFNGQLGLEHNNNNKKPQLVKFFCEHKMVESKNSDFMQTNNKIILDVYLNKIYEKCITIEI